MNDKKDYILGTDVDELERLGFQHRVWSKDAFALWERAGIGRGQRILDLGCGPGFATFDLATIVGTQGKVIGIDKSPNYIEYAREKARANGITNVEFTVADFNGIDLQPATFDAVYNRWVFSWIDDVEPVVQRVAKLLKPGGVFLSQEYLQWGAFRIVPERPEVRRVIEACRESWRRMPSEIDVGSALPAIFERSGLNVIHAAPIAKLSKPGRMTWQWPALFLEIYSVKLLEMGLLSRAERDAFLKVWPDVESEPDSMLIAPLMMEVIGRKL